MVQSLSMIVSKIAIFPSITMSTSMSCTLLLALSGKLWLHRLFVLQIPAEPYKHFMLSTNGNYYSFITLDYYLNITSAVSSPAVRALKIAGKLEDSFCCIKALAIQVSALSSNLTLSDDLFLELRISSHCIKSPTLLQEGSMTS